jgi:enoyl-CoA hydratase
VTAVTADGTSSTARYVRVETDAGVQEIQLNRPDRLNAVSEEVYADLEAAVRSAAENAEVRAVLLTGAGRAFCAGADLKAHAERERTPAERRAYVWAGQRVCRLLQRMPQPVVVAVQGHAIGAGAELALSADVIVCAEDAVFSFPEVGLGTFVGGGVSQRLPLAVGTIRAKQLLLLGRTLTGAEAVRWGMATEAVPADDLRRRAVEIAQQLAEQPRLSTSLAKDALGRVGSTSLDEALVFEAEGLLGCMESDDWTAGVRRFTDGPGSARTER